MRQYIRLAVCRSGSAPFNIHCSELLALVFFAFMQPYPSSANTKFAAQYDMSMSQDDRLCKPIVDFYNRHIVDNDDDTHGFVDDRFSLTEIPTSQGPEFTPGESDGPWRVHTFHKFRIFNNNEERTVILQDALGGKTSITFYTSLLIIKSAYSGISTRKAADYIDLSDRRVEHWVNFNANITDKWPLSTPYLLKRYPNFDEVWARVKQHDFSMSAPVLEGNMTQRFIHFHGRNYIVARQRINKLFRIDKQIGIKGLVYSLNPDMTLNDQCYFELKLSQSAHRDDSINQSVDPEGNHD